MTLLSEAQRALLERRNKEAVGAFRAAVEEEPNNPLAHQGLAQALLRCQAHEESIIDARKALELNSDLAIPHVILAYNSYAKGDQESFTAGAAKAYELEPGSAEVLVCYGIMLAVGKHLDQSIGALNEAVRLQPADPIARRNLAWALSLAGDRRGALRHAKRAYTLRPSLGSALWTFSMTYAAYTPVFGVALVLCTFAALWLHSVYLLIPLSLSSLAGIWLGLWLVLNRKWRQGIVGVGYGVLLLLIAVGAYRLIR